ncbi:hypothetical protein F0P96_10860 [Hymenobacter busanensis]|uniref:Uncharacterized protein n=1 Tax=Hymenobacter busanensis TaxID=2607656 RepID=A0A7L4ZXU4_9BACT|nr:hypothetical protein [Hymenobacter busanensis]KAA9333460.1 hypothetical protein F0P96_10860 [Hymenobacter busanensis]QHJ07857.1 hypothetical protein GUY19_11430 [Hymenobacter busanensis]
MKYVSLSLLAATLLATSCNQSAPGGEQPAGQPTEQAAGQSADTTASGATSTTPADAADTAPAAPETVQLSFRFKPVADVDPMMPKTTAFLVMKGKETKEIELGRFIGKPDLVDAEKAKRAEFPGSMLLGFRSYDPNSGTGDDLAVMQGTGGRLQILQRRTDETADKPKEFQTAREIPMPANIQLEAAPVGKK